MVRGASNLANVVLPDSTLKTASIIGSYAFAGAGTNVTRGLAINGTDPTADNENTPVDLDLSKLEALTTINANAFDGANVKNVKFPNPSTNLTVNANAFANLPGFNGDPVNGTTGSEGSTSYSGALDLTTNPNITLATNSFANSNVKEVKLPSTYSARTSMLANNAFGANATTTLSFPNGLSGESGGVSSGNKITRSTFTGFNPTEVKITNETSTNVTTIDSNTFVTTNSANANNNITTSNVKTITLPATATNWLVESSANATNYLTLSGSGTSQSATSSVAIANAKNLQEIVFDSFTLKNGVTEVGFGQIDDNT